MSEPKSALSVYRFVCSGEFQENCYVVWPRSDEPDSTHPCWIIDPGSGQDAVIDFIRHESLTPQAILLTHGHMDHIAGVPQLRSVWRELPIWIAAGDANAFESPNANMSAIVGIPMRLADRPTRLLADGEELSLGLVSFRVIAVPGHSTGGVCFHCPASSDLFSGDVLFAGSIGRTDFPSGNGKLLLDGIRRKLLALPDWTQVWPGHGESTTIGHEREVNPFLTTATG